MKHLIVLSLILMLPYSFYATNCYDSCANSYWKNVDQAVDDFRQELASQAWLTFSQVAGNWAAYGAGGGLAYQSSTPYWNVLDIEQKYEGILSGYLSNFNYCVGGCA